MRVGARCPAASARALPFSSFRARASTLHARAVPVLLPPACFVVRVDAGAAAAVLWQPEQVHAAPHEQSVPQVHPSNPDPDPDRVSR